MHRYILRSTTHKRARPQNSRFGAGSITVSLTKRDMTNTDWSETNNWLGRTWFEEYNKYKDPSLNQICTGLITEALTQLKLAMGDVKDQQIVFKAQANVKKTW